MSKRRKQRLWTAEEKRTICLQTLAPGVSVAQLARRYALNSNLIFKWLKDPRFAPSADAVNEMVEGAVFLPVEVQDAPVTSAVLASDARPVGEIEIALVCGHRVTVRGSFDGEALARLLKGLDRS